MIVMKTYTDTQDALFHLFTDSTGAHFLDSGGAYGRHWQRNQGMTATDFDSAPAVTADARWSYLDVSISSWHWIKDRAEYSSYWDERFRVFVALHESVCTSGYDGCGCGWFALADMFADMYHDETAERRDYFARGTVNTYNSKDWLTQTLQFTWFTSETTDELVVMLQVHGGADVRGGYTRPVAFTPTGYDGMYDWFDFDCFEMVCEPEPYEPEQTESLPGMPDRPEQESHGWTHRNGEFIDFGGSFVADPWEQSGRDMIVKDGEGEPYFACPECGSPLHFYPYLVG